MINPDRGVEISSVPEPVVNPKRNGSFPNWLNPVIASELTLLVLLGGAAKAEGAGQCEGQLPVFGVKFADHPNIGTRRVIDMTDIYLGNGHFGLAEVYDQKGKEEFDKWDKKDLSKKPKPIASKNMEDRGAYSFARVPFSGECDEENGQAKKVWVTFDKDKNWAIAPEIVKNKGARAHLGGIDEHRVSELQGFIDNQNFTVEKVGDVIKRISKEAVGVEIAFIDIEQLKDDAKTISEVNRESLRLQVARLIKEQEAERKGQGQSNGGGSKNGKENGNGGADGQGGGGVEGDSNPVVAFASQGPVQTGATAVAGLGGLAVVLYGVRRVVGAVFHI